MMRIGPVHPCIDWFDHVEFLCDSLIYVVVHDVVSLSFSSMTTVIVFVVRTTLGTILSPTAHDARCIRSVG